LMSWASTLQNQQSEPSRLREMAKALEELFNSRISSSDIFAAEYILDRIDVLRVLHEKNDARGVFRRGPGWRELFSWKILVAKIFNQLREQHSDVQRACAMPILARPLAAERLEESTKAKESVINS